MTTTYQGLPSVLAPRPSITENMIRPQMMALREFRPFKTSDEYLWAMKEDLSDWLSTMYPELGITPHTFMECLETGVALCKHANNVRSACLEWLEMGGKLPKCWGKEWKLPQGEVTYKSNATSETFFARDNVHNFITWCRKLGIFECLLFESDDLILRKNEKNVILCLLEVARRGSHFGMTTPLLVQFEKEIDRDIAKDTGQELSSSGEEEESFIEYGPVQQIVTNDLRSLDEMVRELVERCSCPTQFPMIRVSEGKYRIGNTKAMIYVRILRSHVMVRVGGGWDTLAHYLDKHDPCRCSSGHRVAVASRFTINKNDSVTPRMRVEYDRRDLPIESVSSGGGSVGGTPGKKQIDLSDSGSEISDEGYKTSDNATRLGMDMPMSSGGYGGMRPDLKQFNRSRYIAGLRSRPGSTDEDRPDSRLTDEESFTSSSTVNNSKIVKSSSTSRVGEKSTPRGFIERGNNSKVAPVKESSTLPRRTGANPAASAKSKTNTKAAAAAAPNTRPTRSYSAGGSREFYGRSYGSSSTPQTPVGSHRAFAGSQRNGRLTPATSSQQINSRNGTWSNYSSTRPRVRTNLFKTDLVEDKRRVSNGGAGDELKDLDLASLIKTALELPSDEDKISHFKLALQQLEQQARKREKEEETATSLPYVPSNNFSLNTPRGNFPNGRSNGLSRSSSLTSATYTDLLSEDSFNNSNQTPTSTIKKRKENGFTKIPKPVFY